MTDRNDEKILRRQKLEEERDIAIEALRMREGPTETIIERLHKIEDELKTI